MDYSIEGYLKRMPDERLLWSLKFPECVENCAPGIGTMILSEILNRGIADNILQDRPFLMRYSVDELQRIFDHIILPHKMRYELEYFLILEIIGHKNRLPRS